MGRIFDNGATRARALAWCVWLLFFTVWVAVVWEQHAASWWAGLCLCAVLALGSRLILVRTRPPKVPVLNYHSVSADPKWLLIADELSIPPTTLQRQLAYLKRCGYRSVFVSELPDLLAGRKALGRGEKWVAITFDDGYADNWVAAFPLLKKYGMKASVFVSTAFIAEAASCRETIEGKGLAEWSRLNWEGYLSWPELKAMRASGLVEIQCHGHEHTRVFAVEKLEGFVGPNRPNVWLLWNNRPEIRSRWWLEIDADRSLWGHPVYEQAPALMCRAWRPDPTAVSHMLWWGRESDVFSMPDWEQRLRNEWIRYGTEHGSHGEWESAENYERRVERDLTEARRILVDKLGVQIDILCWPENAFSDAGERIARRLGYRATVSNRHATTNAVGEEPDKIVRVFIGSPAAGIRSMFLDLAAFVLELKVFEGWYILYPPLALLHAARRIALEAKRLCACRRNFLLSWR